MKENYKPKHSKFENYNIYTYQDLQEFMDDLLGDFDNNDLYFLPENFLRDLRKYFYFANIIISGKVRLKKDHD